MKQNGTLKKLTITVLTLALVVGLLPTGDFIAFASNDFSNFAISNDGGVKATYNESAKKLTITGSGTVNYDKWMTMAKSIDSSYFDGYGWDEDLEEEFQIIFSGSSANSIKLCAPGYKGGLFEGFSNDILFNVPVAIAPGTTNLSRMFKDAVKFNQPINWNTTGVKNMSEMFEGATLFNKPLNFDTSSVENMSEMFDGAESFNQPLNWNTVKVKTMRNMFKGASSFNQALNWNTSSVENMAWMFSGATDFNKSLTFNTSKVTDMSYMFSYTQAFNQNLNFNTVKVTNMRNMFANTDSFNQQLNFNTQNVINMNAMFSQAKALKQPVELNINSATDIKSMFYDSVVESVKLNNSANNTNINASYAFYFADDLKNLEFSGLKNAQIFGFSDDYYVVKNNGTPIAKSANASYTFDDNQSYRVYLQQGLSVGVPTVTLSKSGSAIKVSWTQAANATGYQVYRADKSSGPFTKFKTTSGLSYVNSGNLVPGMPYFYKVRAYRKDGATYTFGNFSAVKGFYAPGALATPAKPSLTLDKNGSGIRLNWHSQKRITGYQVFRSLSPDKPFSYVKTASGTATRYTNLSGLTQGRPYYYKIRAYRMAKGVRKYSSFSSIKGMFAGTNQQALGAVNFSLEDNSNVTAPNVRVRWQNKRWIGLKKTGPNARVYTNINGVVDGKTNYYAMRPYHISGSMTYYGNVGVAKGFKVQ